MQKVEKSFKFHDHISTQTFSSSRKLTKEEFKYERHGVVYFSTHTFYNKSMLLILTVVSFAFSFACAYWVINSLSWLPLHRTTNTHCAPLIYLSLNSYLYLSVYLSLLLPQSGNLYMYFSTFSSCVINLYHKRRNFLGK